MARTSKIPRYREFNSFNNCFGERQAHEGDWRSYLGYHPNSNLTLEIGCGKAELSNGLAARHNKDLYIGIDKKSDRLWRAAKTAQDKKLANIAFIQADALTLSDHFDDSSIDCIWITFPDPFPRDRHEKHRLVNSKFISIYKRLLKPGGIVRFKTDNIELFNYFLNEVVTERSDVQISSSTNDLQSADYPDEFKELTFYEKRWIGEGKKTNFVEFRFI